MSEWYKDWFDSEEYSDVYAHRDETDAENLLKLIRKYFEFDIGTKILDAACGSGRFSNYFAKEGFDVTSFDLSFPLLRIANNSSKEDRLNVKYFRSDIRHLPLKGSFDLVLNMFTSFGYFTTDKENFSFIHSANSLLKNDGIFILDYLNKQYVTNNLIPYSQKDIKGKSIIEERKIDKNRVEKKITIKSHEIEKIFNESVLMYSGEEIIKGFNSCGLNEYKVFGDYLGNSFDNVKSSRLVIFFKK